MTYSVNNNGDTMQIPNHKAIFHSECNDDHEVYIFDDGLTVTIIPTIDCGIQPYRKRAVIQADYHEWILTFDGKFEYRLMIDLDTKCYKPQKFRPVENPEANPICRVLQIWLDMYKPWALDAG
jgi:hypothetical protein